MKDIFVVVVTYNGEEDSGAFLDTYRAYTLVEASLIVVDNASSDQTVDIVRKRHPQAIVLQNTVNRGFAGGARQGMEYAIAHGAKYVGIVNQDVRFSEHWLEPLVDFLETHNRCAAVQPRIMMYPETNIINSYGNAQHYLGFGYTLGYKQEARHSLPTGRQASAGEESRRFEAYEYGITHRVYPEYSRGVRDDNKIYPCENGKELATCSGAATLFCTSALSAVGLIDDAFFMYAEDSDLSWRLRMAGYTLALCCDSTVYHRYEFSRSIQKFYYMERNRFISLFSNYSFRTLLLIAPMLFVMEVGMLMYSMAGTLFGKKNMLTLKEKLRSYAYFFCPSSVRYIAARRRAAQRRRIVPDREIAALFVSTINFQDIDNWLLRRIVNPLTAWYWTGIKKLL